jgi:hypothetical protein
VITAEQLAIEREPPIVVPAPGTVAPRNTHVWVLDSIESGLLKNRGPKKCVVELVSGKSAVGAATTEGRSYVELAPNEPLPADSEHEVRMACEYGEVPKLAPARTIEKTLARFRTSGALDSKPPAWDGFAGREGVTLHLRAPSDESAQLLVYAWRPGEESGRPFDVRLFTRAFPSAEPRIAARVVDLAGNRSELRTLADPREKKPEAPPPRPEAPRPRSALWIAVAGVIAILIALAGLRRARH